MVRMNGCPEANGRAEAIEVAPTKVGQRACMQSLIVLVAWLCVIHRPASQRMLVFDRETSDFPVREKVLIQSRARFQESNSHTSSQRECLSEKWANLSKTFCPQWVKMRQPSLSP